MANWHIKGQDAFGSPLSTELPAGGFSLAINAGEVTAIKFSRRWWSIHHTGKDSNDDAAVDRIFYRHGEGNDPSGLPAADNSDRDNLETQQVQANVERIIRYDGNIGTVINFMAEIGDVVAQFAPNDSTSD